MQLQKFRLMRGIRHLQCHLEADVIAFEVLDQRAQILAGQVMTRCDQKKLKLLGSLGNVVVHADGPKANPTLTLWVFALAGKRAKTMLNSP